jgi:hypothetical protein
MQKLVITDDTALRKANKEKQMDRTRKKKLELPRKIRVGKKMYTIDILETMLQSGDMARVYYDRNRIEVGKKSPVTGRKYSRKEMNDSFWHELVHAILFDMDEHRLNRNEKFVTEFAHRLSEAIDSARFE